jgi:hypothetical protein
MRDKIFDKIWDLQTKVPTINKFFTFSLEELHDNPEKCLTEIEHYLEKHGDKIDDFTFESWIDEDTFKPILMMKMIPVEELAKHLFPSNVLNLLLPSSKESEILRNRITSVLSKYAFDFNDDDTRKAIASDLEFVLSGVEILDKTTFESVDKGILNFIVRHEENEMTLQEYLELVASKKRHERD